MNWYLMAFKNYFNFKGRARRKEYWMFILCNMVVGTLMAILDSATGFRIGENLGVFTSIYGLLIWFPSLALGFRRLHDIDKSAWWFLISLLPVVGWIWLLIYYVQEGTPGSNRYGDDPKR
ncbi:MAG: DUF805 domain-containing protein [Oscillospiraceae bacterium]